ncbi:major facilitator superfamily domain-containing protein [Protomyces lactucae-debilis]|uniref:Major facilitator superfamily domain-containing protein n=1 Tax=Protomyces lactucae-debilis TaxID=2754530 RepID=A0A1Y2EYN7_PROLT|nr:major facilitator superfamily domain-containing protein [Protomyces lactucae-debilis]ORY76374.1 major facilitator superfamily domain-containing protein [Protomyces lactucae-debilis]
MIERTGSPTQQEHELLKLQHAPPLQDAARPSSASTLQSTAQPSHSKAESLNLIYVEWAEGDPENPYNWPKWKKAMVAFVGVFLTFHSAIGAVCYAWGADDIAREFGVSPTLSLLGVSLFTLAFGLAPMALAPLSEVYGRWPVYMGSYAVFCIVQLPNALTPTFAGVLICRFIAGVGASTGSAMVGGTLADMYKANERGMPMAFFTSATLFGTAAGSMYAAYVVANRSLGWRWIFWVELIINGASAVFMVLALRESRGSVLLSRRAKRLRKETGDDRYVCAADAARESLLVLIRYSLTRPFFLLFCEPTVALFSIWASFAWGLLYLFLVAVPIVYREAFDWQGGKASLPFIAMIIGALLGIALSPVQDRLYLRSARKHNGVGRPEARLYMSIIGSLLLSFGMFIFGWSAYGSHAHWSGSAVGILLGTFGIFTIYSAVFSYMSDCYGQWTSSALAGQSFLRNVFASAFPLFGRQMYANLGNQWASSLLGFLALALTAVPIALFIYGPRVRRASKFAASDD